MEIASHSGSANAIQASPDFVPILPPPKAMTTYWRPLMEQVAAVA